MYQEPPTSYGHSGSSLNKAGKAEVDLFPALADRKTLSVVAPRAACNGPEISMFEPTAYEDALDIVECLRSRASTTICLDKMRKTEANRLVDFISGASAAIDGNFHQLSDQVYIFTPSNVQIVVMSKDEMTESSFLPSSSYSTQVSWTTPNTVPPQASYTPEITYTAPSQATAPPQASGGFAAWDRKISQENVGKPQESKRGGTGSVPPLNGEPLDLLYPNTGTQSGINNIWTRRPN